MLISIKYEKIKIIHFAQLYKNIHHHIRISYITLKIFIYICNAKIYLKFILELLVKNGSISLRLKLY